MAEDWLQHTGPLNIISSRNLTPPERKPVLQHHPKKQTFSMEA